MKIIKICLVLMLFAATPALASMIDFEDLDYGPIPNETLIVEIDGITVTFQGAGLQIRTLGGDFDTTYNQTKYLSTAGDSALITVTFFGGSADYVTILNPINGTVTAEVDVIDASAYDDGDGVLDSETSSAEYLTLDGPGIVQVTYDDVNTGYVIGYLEFDANAQPTTPVPTLATWSTLLLIMLMGGIAFRRFRNV